MTRTVSNLSFFFFLFSGFSGFIPQVPIQVLAVTGSAAGASVVFHSHVAASLLADGTNLASKLFAKFQTTSSQFQHQGLFLFDCDVTWHGIEEFQGLILHQSYSCRRENAIN